MIIALSGKIKVGKDLVGDLIKDYLKINNLEHKKFADKLKEITAIIVGCSRKDLECQEFKTKPLGPKWIQYKVCGKSDVLPNNLLFPSRDRAESFINSHSDKEDLFVVETEITPRDILQLIGTEGGRNLIHPDIWCLSLFREYSVNKNWLITDMRFPNEKNIVDDNNGISIKIKRKFSLRFPEYADLEDDNDPYCTPVKLSAINPELYIKLIHESETSLDDVHFNHVIYNDGTIDELKEEIDSIMLLTLSL